MPTLGLGLIVRTPTLRFDVAIAPVLRYFSCDPDGMRATSPLGQATASCRRSDQMIVTRSAYTPGSRRSEVSRAFVVRGRTYLPGKRS